MIIIIPPYGSIGGYLLCLFFVCTVTDFSAAEKDRGVKFCVRVRLLPGQVFSHLVNFGSRGVTVGHYFRDVRIDALVMRRLPARLGGQSELGGRRRRVRPYGGIEMPILRWKGRPIVKYRDTLRSPVRKRLNQS